MAVFIKRIVLLSFFSLLTVSGINAQNGQSNGIPDVYLDCPGYCNETYIRSNVPQVNYVRDQDDADIYLRITSAGTGSGREFTLEYRGISPFSTRQDTVTYFSPDTDTNDEERTGLVRYLRIGLVPYLVNTVAMQSLDIIYDEPVQAVTGAEEEETDPWDSWTFNIRTGASMNGRESEKSTSVDGRFSVNRVTETWKYRANFFGNINRREVELSDGTLSINRDFGNYNGLIAYGLSDHFSIGLFTGANYSQTNNLKLNLQASPAFEYSVFPYAEFQERSILFNYRISPSFRNYYETTIYLKDRETVVEQSLSIDLEYDQPWGNIEIGVSASNYFHDFSINRLEINPELDIRIIRGLSFSIGGRYRSINDQISLPAGDISDEDALTGARQRATSYDYRLSFGLSYTFGSRFSTTVNPRF